VFFCVIKYIHAKVFKLFLGINILVSVVLEEYHLDSKKMVIAVVDMEQSFIPPQHIIRLV